MKMNQRWTEPFARRRFFRAGAMGLGFSALASMLMAQPSLASLREPKGNLSFMKGGPSQVDTDFKPALQRDHGKPRLPSPRFSRQDRNLLASPWSFDRYGESGHAISELFPNLSNHADELCFVHSLHGTNPAHGAATLKLHTGSDNLIRPGMGAWVSYGLGSENENLPAYVTICPTLAHGGAQNWGSAFLPTVHQGCPIGNASDLADKAKIRHISNGKLTFVQQRSQLAMIRSLNESSHLKGGFGEERLNQRIDSFELAFRMQGSVPEAQDISGETLSTRKLYGLDTPLTKDFGQQCLMARRFAERGVRFVQVTHSDQKVQWDQHGNLRAGHAERAAQVDLPIAGLLSDLKARGMLDDTLVVWGGEFGRTPTVQGPKMDGRDHNPHGFTIWMAGGGVKGGFAYGSTDEYGYYAQENPVHVHDFHATLLALLGLDHEKLTYRHAGRISDSPAWREGGRDFRIERDNRQSAEVIEQSAESFAGDLNSVQGRVINVLFEFFFGFEIGVLISNFRCDAS